MPTNDLSFFVKVYQVARLIPYGRVTSYGAIAQYLGSLQSARMVGWAMNASHAYDPTIPAHRVVNRLGLLTGKSHFNPPELMEQLLESEGVTVKEDRIIDFERIFWNPVVELREDFSFI